MDLTRLLLALERVHVLPDGTAHALAYAYGITKADLAAAP